MRTLTALEMKKIDALVNAHATFVRNALVEWIGKREIPVGEDEAIADWSSIKFQVMDKALLPSDFELLEIK